MVKHNDSLGARRGDTDVGNCAGAFDEGRAPLPTNVSIRPSVLTL